MKPIAKWKKAPSMKGTYPRWNLVHNHRIYATIHHNEMSHCYEVWQGNRTKYCHVNYGGQGVRLLSTSCFYLPAICRFAEAQVALKGVNRSGPTRYYKEVHLVFFPTIPGVTTGKALA